MEYLNSQGRDFHVNTGVHGHVNADGKFKFYWNEDSKIFYNQDVESAASLKGAKVTLHEITPKNGPWYHTGVDTIDSFSMSAHKELTEGELDRAYEYFLLKEKQKNKSSV